MIAPTLKEAFQRRRTLGAFHDTEALRLFYGPGESDHPVLRQLALDLFKDVVWITLWGPVSREDLDPVCDALEAEFSGALRGIALMDRAEIESGNDAVALRGALDATRFPVVEYGIPYRVQMTGTKHPGLFLDHAPLRKFLARTQNGKQVLNLFAYTGSLSVAAGTAGAEKVVTLDLSKPTIEWAKENWAAAGLDAEQGDFLYGDVFDWLPKFKKRGDAFDTILCDPPSFSRSKGGTFSTQKDLARLHGAILPLLKHGGLLVTSINSENHSERNFAEDLARAAKDTGCGLRVVSRVDLPPTFPTSLDLRERYLKGFYCIKE